MRKLAAARCTPPLFLRDRATFFNVKDECCNRYSSTSSYLSHISPKAFSLTVTGIFLPLWGKMVE